MDAIATEIGTRKMFRKLSGISWMGESYVRVKKGFGVYAKLLVRR